MNLSEKLYNDAVVYSELVQWLSGFRPEESITVENLKIKMRELEAEQLRIATKKPRIKCDHCDSTGWVIISRRIGCHEMGPCPKCGDKE